jgi:V-type H+-transporting ATPase subunit A
VYDKQATLVTENALVRGPKLLPMRPKEATDFEERKLVRYENRRPIREDFLQQNGFTDYDFFCPLAKTIGMMKVICGFHDAAQKAIAESSGEHKITWNTINSTQKMLIKKITDMKFDMPRQSEAHFKQAFNVDLYGEVIAALQSLSEAH